MVLEEGYFVSLSPLFFLGGSLFFPEDFFLKGDREPSARWDVVSPIAIELFYLIQVSHVCFYQVLFISLLLVQKRNEAKRKYPGCRKFAKKCPPKAKAHELASLKHMRFLTLS